MTVFGSEGNTWKVSYRDGYVTAAGRLQLHYVDYGGMGELVVGLHGYFQNAHAFDGVAAALVPHVRLLALDMRGRGDSDDGPPECYRMNDYLQDLRAFVDVLRLSRFALIGTSLGATLALLYAIAHPIEVTRLVLNDFVPNNNFAGPVRAIQRYGHAPAKFVTLQDALAWFLAERGSLDTLDSATQLAWVSHFLTPAETGGFVFNCDPVLFDLARRTRSSALEPRLRAFQQMFWRCINRLGMPVLILRGANSDVVPRESARITVDSLPAGSLVEVPGVGHSPTLYEPAAQRALREFFGVDAATPPDN